MKIHFRKEFGGVLVPASDREEERMKRFKNGEIYPVEIVHSRNALFHGKIFAFMNYCYEYWTDDNQYRPDDASFDTMREHMTILAGWYTVSYDLSGNQIFKAKSWSYSSMEQEDFENLYQALIQVAMDKIFYNCEEDQYDRLLSFFT